MESEISASTAVMPDISVVVPTCDRPRSLTLCLTALLDQDYPGRYEIVIVNDGQRAVEPQVQTCGHTVRVVMSGVRRGPAHARNVGIGEARAPLILFTDDDTVPSKGWISAAAEAFKKGPDVVGVIGRTESRGFDPLYAHSVVVTSLAVPATCNAAYRREALNLVGRFDEVRFDKAFEDVDLAVRISRLGKITFCEEMLVQHPPQPASFLRLARQASTARYALVLHTKHPHLVPRRLPVPLSLARGYFKSTWCAVGERPTAQRRLRAVALGVARFAFALLASLKRRPPLVACGYSNGLRLRNGPAPGIASDSSQNPKPILLAGKRLEVIGAWQTDSCGVRDYAAMVAAAGKGYGLAVSSSWYRADSEQSMRETWRQFGKWWLEAAGSFDMRLPDAFLVHYSVFAWSHRGFPVVVPRLYRDLSETRLPIITVLHEYAYPWRRRGLRGAMWALAQRMALRLAVARSSALIVTTAQRASWISSRRWLPRRPVAIAPVFSTLPAPRGDSEPDRRGPARIGLFGYGHESIAVHVVLDATYILHTTGMDVRLLLLGAPGPSSPAGRHWQDGARRLGVGGVVEFTGVLPAQELADMLARCDVLLFADAVGPSSRKTTLAASLASGRPVIALNGPQAWPDLLLSEALSVVQPGAQELVGEIRRLLEDREGADALGLRGRAFAEAHMSVNRTTSVILSVLRNVITAP